MEWEDIKTSLEARWRLRQVAIYGTIYGAFSFFLLLVGVLTGLQFGGFLDSFAIVGILFAVWSLLFLPIPLFSLWHYVTICRHAADFTVYEVILDHPQTSDWYRGAVYYEITFEDAGGMRVHAATKPLWSSRSYGYFELDSVHGQKIRVGYRPETGQVIVIGK